MKSMIGIILMMAINSPAIFSQESKELKLNVFKAGEPIVASEVNKNFDLLLDTIKDLQQQNKKLQDQRMQSGGISLPIGTIIGSILEPKRFTELMGDSWVLADGRIVEGAFSKVFTEQIYPSLYVGGVASIPDLRGQFLRGMNVGRTGSQADPDNKRGVGSPQKDAFQGHWHLFYRAETTKGNGETVDVHYTGPATTPVGRSTVQNAIPDNQNGEPRVANETRPNNVAVFWYIKIK